MVPIALRQIIPDAAILRASQREIETEKDENPAKYYPLGMAERSYTDGAEFA
jgi:hypothetical protein